MEVSVNVKVYPAYQKLIDYFTAVLPKTTTDDGVWKLPDGEAFYAYAFRERALHRVTGPGVPFRSGDVKNSRVACEVATGARRKFDQREFYDVALKNGAVPLEILEQQVDAYVQR